MKASYDGYVYNTNDPVFFDFINRGASEPYPKHLAVVQRYFRVFPDRNRTYVDIGAHIGTTIMPYSKMFQTIIGFEPNKPTFEFLEKNIVDNNITNCTVHNFALYNKECRASIVKHSDNSGCFRILESPDGSIECKTLDEQGIRDVDFIKIDTEGTELFVLQGGLETILDSKPFIQLECNNLSELYGVRKNDIVQFLERYGYRLYDTSDENNYFFYYPRAEPKIYCFWTGTNLMSAPRIQCLQQMKETVGVPCVLVTPANLYDYVLQTQPLHPGYSYLSEVHKADYLRTYFMHWYGGGYTDIKKQGGSWIDAFKSTALINGYRDRDADAIAYPPARHLWNQLVGNCAYICKPQSVITTKWYNEMIQFLNEKYEQLRAHPATFPRDAKDLTPWTGYPIEWSEMLGRIFHRVCSEHLDCLDYTVPMPKFNDYM